MNGRLMRLAREYAAALLRFQAGELTAAGLEEYARRLQAERDKDKETRTA